MTTILTPFDVSLAVEDGPLAYWKEILPLSKINYLGTAIDFSADGYMDTLIESHNTKALDQTSFVLADKDNAHTMDPERWRGEVETMAKYSDLPAEVRAKVDENNGGKGLYGKLKFPDKDTARAVMMNPKLGVSARIRENFERVDGKKIKRAIIHVLGTLDPRVTGMSPWLATDLSVADDTVVLDLSRATYPAEGTTMADTTNPAGKALGDYTPAEIDAMTDEELDEFLAAHNIEVDDDASALFEPDAENDDENTPDPDAGGDTGAAPAATTDKTLEPALSNQSQTIDTMDLANVQAQLDLARSEGRAALKMASSARWDRDRAELQRAGVAPWRLDLATPVMIRPDELVVDLSNTDDENLNITDIVRQLLEGSKGEIDMSNSVGHLSGGDPNQSTDDTEADAILAAWPTDR